MELRWFFVNLFKLVVIQARIRINGFLGYLTNDEGRRRLARNSLHLLDKKIDIWYDTLERNPTVGNYKELKKLEAQRDKCIEIYRTL